jgi:hypothetical protein
MEIKVSIMKSMLRLFAVLAAIATCTAAQNSFCQVTTPNGTVNLGYIKAAVYSNVTLVLAESGPTIGTLNFGWCGTVNSSTCNATNVTMAVHDNNNNCIVHFGAIIGPASFANNAASFQMWSASSGAVGTVSVACNANGAAGAATLIGLVVNQPIYSYAFTFSSVHACPK